MFETGLDDADEALFDPEFMAEARAEEFFSCEYDLLGFCLYFLEKATYQVYYKASQSLDKFFYFEGGFCRKGVLNHNMTI